jgi:hypothetical protein
MASREPTRTNYAQSIFGTVWKADRVTQTPFVGSSWPVAKSGVFDPARPYLHPEDVEIALDIDRHDFAVRVNFENGRPVARVETPAIAMPKSPI